MAGERLSRRQKDISRLLREKRRPIPDRRRQERKRRGEPRHG